MKDRKTQIVVVGGGAGGLELVRRLGARFGRAKHDIILIDQSRTHVWKPLLHEVAAGSLDANLDEVGYGGHAARWGYRFFFGTLESIDRERRLVTVAPLIDGDGDEVIGRHSIRYDYLVLAIGGMSNDFGTPGVQEHAHRLDRREEADLFRHKLLNAFLRANHAADTGRGNTTVRVCIVGGGATGVELSAELYNSARSLRTYGLEIFDKAMLEVILIEAGPRILPALDVDLAGTVTDELTKLGVQVRTETQVTRIEKGTVHTGGGVLPADLIVWAAGVKGKAAVKSDLEMNNRNLFVVHPTLQTTRDDRIYAIGDCCFCQLPGETRPVPPRAQSAHQMATLVFANLCRNQSGELLRDFVYRDHGSLVSLSRFAAVGSLMGNLIGGRMAIEGRLARLAYQSLYRMHLIAIHGWLRGIALIMVGRVNQIIRPKLKLH